MKYTKSVLDHFNHPRNVGYLEDYHGIGQMGDAGCGDSVVVTVYLSEDSQFLDKVLYKIKGCPAAIATSSITAEIAEGKTIEDVMKITDRQIIDALGGLPEAKEHCSVLAVTGLHLAIQDAILKRLFIKAGIVKTDAEFEALREEGRLNDYFGAAMGVSHECDGSCDEIGADECI